MNINQFTVCPDCGGSGNSTEHDRCLPPNYYICETCKGTGYKIVSNEYDLDVPEDFVYYAETQTDIIFRDWNFKKFKNFKLKHKVGDRIDLVCDVCCGCGMEGSDGATNCDDCTGCIDSCPSCKGNPKITIECISVEVKGNKVNEKWIRENQND